jgi:Zn finger protein HypA/HybF involved in hydrogenase expression
MAVSREFVCADCSNNWQVSFVRVKPGACPQCGSANVQRAVQGRGLARFHKGSSKDRGRRWIR